MPTEKITFTFQNIKFEALVTYSKERFATRKSFYKTELMNPIKLNCGYHKKGNGDFFSLMSKDYRNTYFIVEKDLNKELDKYASNIYPIIIKNIKYYYFNQKEITYYKNKIKDFEKALDNKDKDSFAIFSIQKSDLKKLLKNKMLDSKSYQKMFTSLRQEKEELEYSILQLKINYTARYFICGRLKDKLVNKKYLENEDE